MREGWRAESQLCEISLQFCDSITQPDAQDLFNLEGCPAAVERLDRQSISRNSNKAARCMFKVKVGVEIGHQPAVNASMMVRAHSIIGATGRILKDARGTPGRMRRAAIPATLDECKLLAQQLENRFSIHGHGAVPAVFSFKWRQTTVRNITKRSDNNHIPGGQQPRRNCIFALQRASSIVYCGAHMGNTFKTAFLLTALTLLLLFLGRILGGQNGMVIALVIAAVLNFISYFYSDKIALTMYRAQPVTREQLPRAYAIVERLTQKIGIPMPKMYVIPTDSPNAFATGRNPNHASVAVTQGILNLLNDEELEGVLAHELGHVRNRDILISSIAATVAGAITYLAEIGRWGMIFGGYDRDDNNRGGGFAALFMLILAPIAAFLIQLAVSRSREYQADETGAHFTGNPYALASALAKLDAYSKRLPLKATPSTAHLFIIQPFLGMNMMGLFQTHPPIAKRIERLTGRPAEFTMQ